MDLKKFIRSVPDFPIAGILFRDISPLLADADAFDFALNAMAKEWSGKGVTKVAGFDARGFVFGSPLARQMKLPFVMLRKPGKLPGKTLSVSYGLEYGTDVLEMGIGAVSAGDSVLLVDDLLATGGTALAGAHLVEKAGGKVAGYAFAIELDGLGGKEKLADYAMSALMSYGDEA